MTSLDREIDHGDTRDPKHVNRHIQVEFDDVIGEPLGVQSIKYSWVLNRLCYRYSKIGLYIVLSTILGPFIAFAWGILYASIAFFWVWLMSPATTMVKLLFNTFRLCARPCTQATVAPCFEAFGSVWSNVRLKHYTLSQLPEKDDTFLV